MLDTELDSLPRLISRAAEPLPDIDDPAFGASFDRFGDARIVLLGEASHGTSDDQARGEAAARDGPLVRLDALLRRHSTASHEIHDLKVVAVFNAELAEA